MVKAERLALKTKIETLKSRLNRMRPRLSKLLHFDYEHECLRIECAIYSSQERIQEMKNKKGNLEEMIREL